jgi:hypothetical protein
MSTDTEQLPVLKKAFEEFATNYMPTQKAKCELKSSAEIQVLFNELTGLETTRYEIADGLEKLGYQFKLIGDEYMWMVEKIEN